MQLFPRRQRKLESFRKKNINYLYPSFKTIAGTGSNGAIVHYKTKKGNSKTIKKNDIFLCDSGGQYKFGTTDVTRTICFSKPSKKIFDHSLKIMKINAENCVFVGDQIDTDIIGAQNANIKPILIDRENLYSEYKDCVVINNLNELLDVINL